MGRKKIERPEADRIRSILITRTAIKELTSEDIIEKVITFQFKDFREMVYEHNQIEVSGFGKFLISHRKLDNQKGKMMGIIKKFQGKLDNEPDVSEIRKGYWTSRVKSATEILEFLKTRESGYETKS